MTSDRDDATGILETDHPMGQGPGINTDNIQEALNKSVANAHSVMVFDIGGNRSDHNPDVGTFKVEKNPLQDIAVLALGWGKNIQKI